MIDGITLQLYFRLSLRASPRQYYLPTIYVSSRENNRGRKLDFELGSDGIKCEFLCWARELGVCRLVM